LGKEKEKTDQLTFSQSGAVVCRERVKEKLLIKKGGGTASCEWIRTDLFYSTFTFKVEEEGKKPLIGSKGGACWRKTTGRKQGGTSNTISDRINAQN